MKKIYLTSFIKLILFGNALFSMTAMSSPAITITHVPVSVIVYDKDTTGGDVAVNFGIQAIDANNVNSIAWNGSSTLTANANQENNAYDLLTLLNFSGQTLYGTLQVQFNATFHVGSANIPAINQTENIVLQSNNSFPIIPETFYYNSNNTASCSFMTDNNATGQTPEIIVQCATNVGAAKR